MFYEQRKPYFREVSDYSSRPFRLDLHHRARASRALDALLATPFT